MTLKRKLIAALLTAILLIGILPADVFAQEKNNTETKVQFADGVTKDQVPDYIIKDLIQSNPDTDCIIIYDIGGPEDTASPPSLIGFFLILLAGFGIYAYQIHLKRSK